MGKIILRGYMGTNSTLNKNINRMYVYTYMLILIHTACMFYKGSSSDL